MRHDPRPHPARPHAAPVCGVPGAVCGGAARRGAGVQPAGPAHRPNHAAGAGTARWRRRCWRRAWPKTTLPPPWRHRRSAAPAAPCWRGSAARRPPPACCCRSWRGTGRPFCLRRWRRPYCWPLCCWAARWSLRGRRRPGWPAPSGCCAAMPRGIFPPGCPATPKAPWAACLPPPKSWPPCCRPRPRPNTAPGSFSSRPSRIFPTSSKRRWRRWGCTRRSSPPSRTTPTRCAPLRARPAMRCCGWNC